VGTNWQWPASTKLAFVYNLKVSGVVRATLTAENTPPGLSVITVASGTREDAEGGPPVLYTNLRITVPSPTQFTSLHENAAVKLVTTNDRYSCYRTDNKVPVGFAGRDNGVAGSAKDTIKGDLGYTTQMVSLTRQDTGGADNMLLATTKIIFMWGGTYHLCYTPDGTFDAGVNKANMVDVSIKVLGVKSPCSNPPSSSVKEDGCIEKERWDCFFGREGDGSVNNCIFSFKDDGARLGWSVTTGDRSKLTWSDPYGADTIDVGTGKYTQAERFSTAPKWCAVAPPTGTSSIFNTDTTGTILVADKYTAAEMPPVKSTQSEAFTLSACYCPSYDVDTGEPCSGLTGTAADRCCEKHEEFIQMVGRIYYWTIRICDMANYAGVRSSSSPAGCASPYRRVLPQQKFVLRIECPPGGACESEGNNLVRYVEPTVDSSLPSWKETHPCRVTGESAAAVWPTASASGSATGGDRVDYKVWYAQPVKINKSLKQQIDVCYTNSIVSAYYFKVGTIKTADAFAFASKFPAHWDDTNKVGKKTIRYAGYEGSFTMYSGISGAAKSPYDGNPFSGKAMSYFMSFDRERLWGVGSAITTLESYLGLDKKMNVDTQTELDKECQKNRPSAFLTSSNPLPLAQVPTAESQHLTFSGPSQNEYITVNVAGVIAVCYCAIISDSNQCEITSNWMYAGRMTIQGPEGGSTLWEFDTNIVVKMRISGWGLSQDDRLRIIPSTASCTDNSGNPTGATSFKTGCPAMNGVDCKDAETNTDITLNVFSGPGKDLFGGDQANTIVGIEVQDTVSHIEFSDNIHDLIHEGDIITIEYDSITINSKATAGDETPTEKYDKYLLSGEYDYQDTTGSSQTLEKFQLGHKVSKIENNGVVEPKKLSIPIGWPLTGRPTFTFPARSGSPGGRWTVRSRAETGEELRGTAATTPGSDLKVCWGVRVTGATTYYQQAGTLKFIDPPQMSQAAVYMTTVQTKAIAPTVIYFKTGATRAEYSTTTGKTKLMLRFLDISEDNGKLEWYFAEDHKPTCPSAGGCPTKPNPDQEVLYRNARQYLCGRLFSELWSEDAEGFPVPTGCYFSKRWRDYAVTLGNSNPFYQEVTLVFNAKNGLKANTKYMMVMNARNPTTLNPSAAAIPVVDLYTMCAEDTGCIRPYKVFEKATGSITRATVPRSDDMNNPRLSVTNGFNILSSNTPDDGTLNLSEMNIMQIKLTAGPGLRSIRPQAIIRMYMSPLTQWNVGRAQCTASCVPFEEVSSARCSGSVGCDPEAVLNTAHHDAYNAIKLTLPSDMDPITDVTTHTLKVQSLTLPLGGFFPSRVGVQLSREDDTDPSYTTSAGLIWKNPEAGRTEGRLVLTGPTGSGSKPFINDANNRLVVRIQFGATLWNWGESGLAAMVEIRLPKGYMCKVIGQGEPSMDLDVFKVDANGDGYYDNPRGLLAVTTDDGNWERSSENSCQYELLRYNRIYEKQVIYVEVDATNPGTIFRKDDLTNVWAVSLSSKGADTNSAVPAGKTMPLVTFTNDSTISLTEGLGTYFGGNAAVIKELEMPLFQPGVTPDSMTRSCCGATFDQRKTQQYMRVFFKPGVSVGQRGFVIVDAPNGFDFGATCTVGELASEYYAFAGDQELRLKPLKPPLLCEGRRYPPLSATTYNRARIRVTGLIDVINLIHYGFQILVTHPTTYSTDQHDNWKLWLEDAQGYPLEGSRNTVLYNPKQAASQTLFYHKSWGMYANPIENILIRANDWRPYQITGSQDASLTIWPITFTMATQTSLRITAPFGFIWSTDWTQFNATTNCVELQPCEPFGGVGGVLPQVESTVDNVLVWTQVYFNPNVKYGFQHKIRIPLHNPRTSANTFYIEFGYKEPDINNRMYAAAIESPRVASLINCRVGFNTNQVGWLDNRMQFELQTMTPIGVNGGIVIIGNENTKGFAFTPEYTMLDGSDAFPADVTLTAIRQVDATSRITIKVQSTPIGPGYYKFEMKVSNPTARITTPGKWTFGTYEDVSAWPDKKYIDNEMVTPGFVISNRMQHAGFYPLSRVQEIATSREDRPGYMNNVVIEFELRNRPEEVKDMTVKAPHGFAFEDDCLGPPSDPKLKTSLNTVFGDNTGGSWPAGDLEEWKANVAPLACRGEGREAVITIPVGLQVLKRYAFRIRVQNPLNSPDWNRWTLDYNSEASDPFQGFNIWTAVGKPLVIPTTYSRNQGGSVTPITNPVTIMFRPYKTVPSKPSNEDRGGVIRVEAPAGFKFVHTNRECEIDLRVTGASQAILRRDYLCEVDASETNMNIYMMGNTEIRGEDTGNGNEYQLIVYVNNPTVPQPASDWILNTFSKENREPAYSLDETTIPGFPIRNDLWRFLVTNNDQEFNGNQKVNDVEIVMNFRDNIKDGDDIILYAPRGFDIVGNPELNLCENYRPVGVSNDWFPFTGAPECKCEQVTNGPLCRLEWLGISEGKDPAFAQKQDITIKIGSRNPPKTPFISDNFWLAEHHSGFGGLLAAQVAQSWDINPQLADVVITFANGYRSAGSQANLDVIFTPVNDACCLEVQAEFPTEFDFTQATVFANYDVLQQEGPRMVVNLRTPGLIADQKFTLRIYNVRLGRGGGQTTWNLITYADAGLTVKADERLQFQEGAFRLPGKIALMTTPILTSAWKESAVMYPVKSLFLPRVAEWGTAEFRLSFSQPVYAQGKLVIISQGAGDTKGYTLRTDGFVIIGTGQVDSTPVLDPVSGSLQATLKANRPASEVALLANTPYTISIRVYPMNDGVNTWRFDTVDSMEGFTNTNDGDSAGFNPVLNFLLTVTVERSPPKAVIEVILDVDPKGAVVRELLVIAPPGFTFDDGPNGCGDMCVPGQALGSTGRRTATIASPTGQPLTKLTGLRIRVQSPEQTPIGSGSEGIMWFVEGRGQGVGATLGWGQGSGFAVTQMSGTAVYYAGVTGLMATQIAFTFSLDVDAGSTISIVPPAGFLLTCSVEGSMKTISLPGGRPNCIDDPLQLQLQEPLTRGTYAFAITADLPPQTPEVNTFNIIIQDQYNKVVDSAYGVIGEEIVNIGAESPTLAWSRADPGQPTMVTVGITFTEDTSNLQALLIMLPDNFQHDVQIPIDVQNLNSRFPLAPGVEWADTSESNRIKINLDDAEDVTTIPADTYRFSFPVLMPPDVPRRNIWFLALCSDRSCRQPSDRQVVVSFPIAGFALYEIAPAALKVAASGAERRRPLSGHTFVLSLLALLLSYVLQP